MDLEKLKIPNNIEYSHVLLDEASVSIGAYNSLIKNSVIDINMLLYLLTLKESETTSRLEGTKITFEDLIISDDNERDKGKRSPVMETLGVKFAIEKGNKMLDSGLPISTRFIKSIHKPLMYYAQYENKNVIPGEFRNIPVRVGKKYFPPDHQLVAGLMSDLEKYIHNKETNISPVVKVGIIHAQFERIHPFADGNGRIGRLLISFLLKEYGITGGAHYFMSPYIEKQKNLYYDGLEFIEYENGWNRWIGTFLDLVIGSSNETIERIEKLNALYIDGGFLNFYNKNSQYIKNYIFIRPIFKASNLKSRLARDGIEVSISGVKHQLKNSNDIALHSQGKGRSENIYRCNKLMDLMTSF